VSLDDLNFIFEDAGPKHGQGGNGKKPRDETKSGYGFRFFMRCIKQDMDQEESFAAILKHKGRAGIWARGTDRRELERTFEEAEVFVASGGGDRPPITELKPISELKEREPHWAWWPYLPASRITLLAGPEGSGKGLMCMDIAARYTQGDEFPFSKDQASQGGVLLLEAEDNFEDTVLPRLKAAGADIDRVFPAKLIDRIYDLPALIARHNIKLIIISPLNLFLKADNQNDYRDVGVALAKMQEAVEHIDCAIIAITHLNKKADLAALERIIGSRAYTAHVRNVLMMGVDDDGSVRLMHTKRNLSSKGKDLLFSIKFNAKKPRSQRVQIEWEEAEEDVDPDKALTHKPTDARATAGEWLFDLLKDGEKMDTDLVKERAERASMKWRTVRKAKERDPRFGHCSEGLGPARKTFWFVKQRRRDA
jgi:hypothetical protein